MAILRRPEDDDLYADLAYQHALYDNSSRRGGATRHLTPGHVAPQTNTRYLNNQSVMRRAYGISDDLAERMEDTLGFDILSEIDFDDRSEFMQNTGYFRDLSDAYYDDFRAHGFYRDFDPSLGGTYVSPDEAGTDAAPADFRGSNRVLKKPSMEPAGPDFYREIPTTTSYPLRPRTVAAVWDANRSVLTVVFRDGTMYNYYDVDLNTWLAFKQRTSKGRAILDLGLNEHSRGPVNMNLMPIEEREFLYRAARTAQVRNAMKSGYQTPQKRTYTNYPKSYKYNNMQQAKAAKAARAAARRARKNP